jgi:phosphodiesterase/alkaline phosphatase D-like protein
MSEMKTTKGMSRRGFLAGTGAFAATAVAAGETNTAAPEARDPFLGTQGVPLKVGFPNLQAPGETTMGVSWKVSGLAKGVVEYADNPAFENSAFARPGGYGLVPVDVSALQVRLENLKPATRYWYRTITTPFVDYRNIYDAKLGEPVVSKAYSFTTLGAGARAHFCVMNDTHAQWKSFQMVAKKLKELAPAAVVWNGDATNTTLKKETAVEIFLAPPVVCAHTHRSRFDEPTATRPWAQVVGGGPELGRSGSGRFPTVIEGRVENGRLRLLVHDVFDNRVVLDREIVSSEGLKSPRVASVGK